MVLLKEGNNQVDVDLNAISIGDTNGSARIPIVSKRFIIRLTGNVRMEPIELDAISVKDFRLEN